MRILIIDDDISIVNMLTEMLRVKHAVHGTTSADFAIELLKHNEYDVVLVDYNMPDHDGTWFMKNAHLPRKTVALLLTGDMHKSMLVQMFKLGISGYLTKPVSIDEVQQNIEFYSHSGQYASYSATA